VFHREMCCPTHFRCRCLSQWGLRGTKCLPSGQCSTDWRRRNGRLEPLRYFLICEIPFIIILLIVTVITYFYYFGQRGELPNNAIVGTHFNWKTGCAVQFDTFASTHSYHDAVTSSPFMVLLLVMFIGLPLRFTATKKRCDYCLSSIGGTRSAERLKVGRGIFTCMLVLGSGLQFLLAPVLTFGWTSNVVCHKNETCGKAMITAFEKQQRQSVCCSEYAKDPITECNQATYRILFITAAAIFPFALCWALISALTEKAKFHGKKIGTSGKF
jgi:hypothetical protein